MVKQLIFDVVKQYAIPIYSDDFISDSKNFDIIQFRINIGLFYETLLMMIRGETIRFSKQKARKYRALENETICEISRLQESFNNEKTRDCLKLLHEAQSKLENIRKQKIMGAITRSRVRWHEEGEKCTKYFLSLEKRNAMQNSILSLNVNGHIITKKEEILDNFSNNLQAKYRKDETTEISDDYLKENIKRKLSVEQREILDEPLSLQELHTALKRMKKGRSPGTNGFTSDFF